MPAVCTHYKEVKERLMKNHLLRSIMMLACLSLLLVPGPANAQTSPVYLTIKVNPTTITAGSTVGVIATIGNNTTKKMRATVTITSLSPCGVLTQIGYHKVALNPGQGIMVTVPYPTDPDGCRGTYTISANASGASTSTYLLVQ